MNNNKDNQEDSENKEKELDNLLDELIEENKSRIGGIKKIIDDMEKRIQKNK